MKKTFWIFLFVVGITIVFLAFWLTRAELPKSHAPSAKEFTDESTRDISIPIDKRLEQPEWSGLEEKQKRRMMQGYQKGIQSNVPIQFYGKVSDQNQKGVSTVKVNAEIHAFDEVKFFDPTTKDDFKIISLEVTTGGDGRFSITDAKGRILMIKGMQKEGYGPFIASRGMFVYDPSLQDVFHPDPQNPVIFQMWKSGQTEPLIKAENNLAVTYAENRILTVDLIRNKIIANGSAAGDLKIQIKQLPTTSLGHYPWSLIIDAVDGGIIETKDAFLYRAPESGYETGYEFIMDPIKSTWSDKLIKRFYVRSRGGRVYAGINLQVLSNFSHDGKTAYIEIDYLANPAGSRNLEYDPAKKINKQ